MSSNNPSGTKGSSSDHGDRRRNGPGNNYGSLRNRGSQFVQNTTSSDNIISGKKNNEVFEEGYAFQLLEEARQKQNSTITQKVVEDAKTGESSASNSVENLKKRSNQSDEESDSESLFNEIDAIFETHRSAEGTDMLPTDCGQSRFFGSNVIDRDSGAMKDNDTMPWKTSTGVSENPDPNAATHTRDNNTLWSVDGIENIQQPHEQTKSGNPKPTEEIKQKPKQETDKAANESAFIPLGSAPEAKDAPKLTPQPALHSSPQPPTPAVGKGQSPPNYNTANTITPNVGSNSQNNANPPAQGVKPPEVVSPKSTGPSFPTPAVPPNSTSNIASSSIRPIASPFPQSTDMSTGGRVSPAAQLAQQNPALFAQLANQQQLLALQQIAQQRQQQDQLPQFDQRILLAYQEYAQKIVSEMSNIQKAFTQSSHQIPEHQRAAYNRQLEERYGALQQEYIACCRKIREEAAKYQQIQQIQQRLQQQYIQQQMQIPVGMAQQQMAQMTPQQSYMMQQQQQAQQQQYMYLQQMAQQQRAHQQQHMTPEQYAQLIRQQQQLQQ